MSVNVNVFRPSLNDVNVQSTGTIVVKLNCEDSEVNLFFMNSALDSEAPAVQIVNLVSSILSGAGFDSYEFEKVDGLTYHGQPVCEAFFDHHSLEPAIV